MVGIEMLKLFPENRLIYYSRFLNFIFQWIYSTESQVLFAEDKEKHLSKKTWKLSCNLTIFQHIK